MANPNGNGRSDPERRKFERDLLELMPFLNAFARSLAHDHDLAEDLAQDAVERAWKARDTFEPGTNLKAWLFTILRNEFYSNRRRALRQQPWDPELAEKTLTSETEISETEAADDFRRFATCLACLSNEHSDAVVAVGYLGMSYEAAALVLDCAVGTAKSRVARGRKELRALIDSNSSIELTNVSALQFATKGIPKSHRLYPIAKAYEDIYAAIQDSIAGTDGSRNSSRRVRSKPLSPEEKAWQDVVASGAFDEIEQSIDELLRQS